VRDSLNMRHAFACVTKDKRSKRKMDGSSLPMADESLLPNSSAG